MSTAKLRAVSDDGGIPHDKRSKEPIEFFWALCNNRIFAEALELLDEKGHEHWHTKTIFAFNRIKDAFDSNQAQYNAVFKKLVDKHAHMEPMTKPGATPEAPREPVLDAKGKPKLKARMVSIGRGQQDWDWKDKSAWLKAFYELGARTFTVKAYKLTTEELLAVGLSPKQLRMCVILTEDADPEILQSFRDSVLKALEREEEAMEDDDDPDEEAAANDSDDSPD